MHLDPVMTKRLFTVNLCVSDRDRDVTSKWVPFIPMKENIANANSIAYYGWAPRIFINASKERAQAMGNSIWHHPGFKSNGHGHQRPKTNVLINGPTE